MTSQHVPPESTPASQIWYSISGIWLLLVLVATHWLSLTIGFELSEALIPVQLWETTPWGVIRQDYIHGLCHAVALLFCLSLGLAMLERYRAMASTTIWMSFMTFSPDVWKMMVIRSRCQYVMSTGIATSSWLSFDSYFYDPLIQRGPFVAISIGFILAMILIFLEYRRKIKSSQPVEKLTHPETIPPQF